MRQIINELFFPIGFQTIIAKHNFRDENILIVDIVGRAVQTTCKSDPPSQTDQTQTVRRSIQPLQRSMAGPSFPKPILGDRVRVSSCNTQATQPDRHINGFKGVKFVNQSYSSPYFPKSSFHSQFLPFTDLTTDVYRSPILLVVNICLSIVNLCPFIVDLCSLLSTFALRLQCPSSSSPPFLRFNSWTALIVDFLFGFVDLFFGFVDFLFGFVDLLILFFRNQTTEV